MTLAERLSVALARPTEPALLMRGDHSHWSATDDSAVSAAAVLVAVTDRAAPGIILTQRPNTMRRHPGQIAFPGGRIDPGDAGPIAAALREAQEEIALAASEVTVIGTADRYRTGTGFDITPVLAVIPPDLPLVAQPDEVVDWFEVPVAFLFDPANHGRASAEWQGQRREFYEIRWQDRRIWGATAGMIVNMSNRLQWPQ